MKYLDFKALEYYDKQIKQYINMRISLNINKIINCPNCGAPITSTKCEYCNTDFELMNIE